MKLHAQATTGGYESVECENFVKIYMRYMNQWYISPETAVVLSPVCIPLIIISNIVLLTVVSTAIIASITVLAVVISIRRQPLF